jgi:hypothetical protein
MRILGGLCLLVTLSLSAAQARAQATPVEPPQSTAPAGAAPPAPAGAVAPAPAGAVPPAPAGAVAPAPAGAVPPAPAEWQTNDIGWLNRYTVARERLLAGDFGEARQLFADLVATATSGPDRSIALELERVAQSWASRELVLVRRIDLGESNVVAKVAGERTSDEIAVLYTNAVIYGLGTGVWVDFLTEPDSLAGAILPALGLAGAAAGAVAAVDSSKRLRYGVPQSTVSGMYIGLQEGLVLMLWNQAHVYYADEWSPKTAATVVWGMATAGAAAGAIVGTVGGTTPGRASFVGSAAMWSGLVTGMLVASATPDDDQRDDRALLAAAIGLNAGAVAGIVGAGPVSPSIARVRFLDLGGLAGGIAAGGLYLSAAGDESTAAGAMGLTALGIAGGLTTAWFATSGMPADRLSVEIPGAPRGAAPFLATATASLAPAPGGATLALRAAF